MKHILITSFLILTASFFFVINDAIINYIAPRGIEFYHFIFYGSPAYFVVPIFLFLRGNLKKNIILTVMLKIFV